ncbi:polymerase [Puchong virus]|uniref:Replicase n=2 Tax=Puchong virus TaxID=1272955 RepID=A0A7D0J0U1_9RHAB|nr:polymerase [Puchong virus]QEA08648.1 polymerase [Puchong virus]
MDSFLNQEENLEGEYFDQFENDLDIEYDKMEEIIDSMDLINNKDYNLNSPLIPDELEQLINFIRNTGLSGIKEGEGLYAEEEAILIKRVLKNIVNPNHLPGVDDLHKKFSEFLNVIELNQRYWQTGVLIGELVDGLKEIPKAFFRGIGLDEDLIVDDLQRKWNDVPNKAKGWLLKFLDLHKVVCLMNARSKLEIENIKRKEKTIEISSSSLNLTTEQRSIIIEFETSGRWIIFNNNCYSVKYNMLLNREFVLMIKDVLISRFQTVLSLVVCRDEYPYSESEMEKVMQLYLEGDELLRKHGNKAYKGIKLVESLCNLRIINIVAKSRPLIPKFPNFENHIYKSIDDLKKERNVDLDGLAEIILYEDSIDMTLVYYSSFRHWGHPWIDYLTGLKKLEEQVNKKCDVDESYANKLASDLAFKVLKKTFLEKKVWAVEKEKVDIKNKLYKHIKHNTWPTQQIIDDFGDNWHLLPLRKCYDIPDMIDISLLYSDKSHSLDRSEVIKIVREGKHKRIPTKRVLQTLLERRATNWPEFLKAVNDYGLDWEKLVIGLKAKERELKEEGRFFSMMSFELRDYFVSTEYLIKKYYVPLFEGLTMADDLNTVIKKMLDVSSGQGSRDYQFITIANNIDYEKWNNYQRLESNGPVFRVMGQFLGLPNLFVRTHEFFQKSLIYYNHRADLMLAQGNRLVNKTGVTVCWEGQLGGLEGLRQKGWSILNYLMIERESRIRNTRVKILAQGDNQTISMHYKTESWHSEEELKANINRMVENNNQIMSAIIEGTKRLGLKINHDETMTSPDYINYGKVPIIEGTIRGLPTKRWSRVNFTSNDQLPSTSTVLNSSSTNALTVCHFSERPIDAINGHLVLGSLGLLLLDYHNPALRGSPSKYVKEANLSNQAFNQLLMYLDPSLGGIGGTSLTRFFIRGFPDGVTESLSFWKIVHENTTDPNIKNLCISVGDPDLNNPKPEDLDKLIEKPESLNIRHGLSSSNMLKGEVKKNLIQNCARIENEIVRDAAKNMISEETQLYLWLRNIKPLFPRFLSQFAESTYYGVTKGLINLFTNSKTIRGIYRKKYAKELDALIIESEIKSIASLIRTVSKSKGRCQKIWECSASHADSLRRKSWGTEVLGTTVPHPSEMFSGERGGEDQCTICAGNDKMSNYLTVITPKGVPTKCISRGPYYPYLGSTTRESTSILQPWEKETKVPVLRRACDLRKAINWFVEPNSNVAKSIFNNLRALTGEDWEDQIKGYKRTGSSLHRFTCSRVSAGGYAGNSPSAISWCVSTTDTMCNLGDQNYDFMFQSTILWCQILTVIRERGCNAAKVYHYHITCSSCLREIEEPSLESDWEYEPRDVSLILEKWRPQSMERWGEEKIHLEIQDNDGEWAVLDELDKSYEVGKTIGWLTADSILNQKREIDYSSLYPISIRGKLRGGPFFSGLLDGFKLSSSLNLTHRRNYMILKKPRLAIQGTVFLLIDRCSFITELTNFVSHPNLYKTLKSVPHKIPASYPMNLVDVGSIVRCYLKHLFYQKREKLEISKSWVFSDMRTNEIIISYGLSHLTHKIMISKKSLKEIKIELQQCQDLYIQIMSSDLNDKIQNIDRKEIHDCLRSLRFVSSEIRHAVKFGIQTELITEVVEDSDEVQWGPEFVGQVYSLEPWYLSCNEQIKKVDLKIPYISNPLISGVRINQIATGAHYKIRAIIERLRISYQDFICGGDGSGGMTSCLLRINRQSRGIFNSLLMLEDKPLHGTKPGPPTAILELGGMSKRCVNLNDVWKEPSDLSKKETWKYFERCRRMLNLRINLMVLDMECISEDILFNIHKELIGFLPKNMEEGGVLIIKTYLAHLLSEDLCIVEKLAHQFDCTLICNTQVSSTNTSEVYVTFRGYRHSFKPMRRLNREHILQNKDFFFVFRSTGEEFKRALGLLKEDLGMGAPSSLSPDLMIELSQLLYCSGVDGVSIASLCQPENLSFFSLLEFGYILIIILSESHVRTSKIHKLCCGCKDEEVLSDQRIKLWLSSIGSLALRISLESNNIGLYDCIHQWINNTGDLRLTIAFREDRTLRWMVSTGKCRENSKVWCKGFGLSDKLALMGNWIRWYERFRRMGTSKGVKEGKVNNFLSFINKGLSLKHAIEHYDPRFREVFKGDNY